MKQSGIMRFLELIMSVVIAVSVIGNSYVPVWAQTPTPPSPPMTATPTPTPASLAPSPVLLRLIAEADPDPLPAGAEAEITLSLELSQRPNTECAGILGAPLDAYFVIDNSASAGTGRGSNIALTQQWLRDWLAQAEPVVFTSSSGLPQRIRLGIVASRVTPGGTELLWQTLTEDYAQLQLAVDALASGGDTSLAPGIAQAATALQQRGRPNARQALVLILHDRLSLTNETVTALESTRQEGIEIYVFVNSLNLNREEVATAARIPWVDAAHFWLDPDKSQRQKALVQMTGGADDYLAQNIELVVPWLPIGVTVVSGIGAMENVIVWSLAHLAKEETVEATYRAKIAPELAAHGRVTAIVPVTYRDCNGIQRAETLGLSLDVEPASVTATPEATSTATPPLLTSTPGTMSTTESPADTSETQTPGAPQGDVSLPTVDVPTAQPVTPQFFPSLPPIQGPIDQLFVWLVGLIPGISGAVAPLIGVLPVILQWLLIAILVILLLLLLWWLIRKLLAWRRNRKVKGALPPSAPQGGGRIPPTMPEPSVPEWLTKLPENPLISKEKDTHVR